MNIKLYKNKILTILLFIILFLSLIFSFNYLYNNTTPCYNDNSNNGIKLPIIMYHHICKLDSRLNDFTIKPEQFEKDMLYLKEKGYETISVKQLLDYVNNNTPLPEKPIMITFDDGHESFYEYIYPMLKQYNLKAVLSVVGSYTDTYSENEDHNINYSYLTWKQINEMSDSGLVEIGNHTYDLHTMDKGRNGCSKKSGESLEQYKNFLTKDVLKLQDKILNYTGRDLKIFTYPFGRFSKETKEIIKDLDFSVIFNCSQVVNVIDKNNSDIVYNLGRFNRPNGISTEQFFKKIIE
ncbi:polysaccharide deacetylase family protein [uncultured Tyzzerella sp.]|uniref:polysaccharide deacetylase family protein n=1 Tax=uncultured Tyzzerella sp. TaxID=2321398 RepID=UPI0029431F82|nr:polysaccharide deacetylase family protein [uncultured Tyzzerella sp.]